MSQNNTNHDDSDDDSDDGQLHQEAVLNCYFHVMQAIGKKTGYAKKIVDPSFAANRKDKPHGSMKGTAYWHITGIAMTKTIEQRRVVTDLYMTNWRERGEDAAAEHFEKEYCRYPTWNWNYSCSGECGVYPSNCPNESFNRHGIKGVCADCPKNASLPAFLIYTAPRLLRDDAIERSDPCTIEFPKTCSHLMVTITAFLREGMDIIELGCHSTGKPSGWIGNLRHKIGTPLDRRRIRLIQAAMDGDVRPFQKVHPRGVQVSNEELADSMVSATRSVCHLQWKDGTIVGDCEDCFKHLGYNCPCATYLRSKYDLLLSTLQVQRKTSANSRGTAAKVAARGDTARMYQSGPSRKGGKRRCLPAMLDLVEDYIGTLNHQQLGSAIQYLYLCPRGRDMNHLVKTSSESELRERLIAFHDNTSRYRQMLLGTSNGNPSAYEHVRALVGRIEKALPAQASGKENPARTGII
ncbi:hypothetical protein SEMRO_336_G120320.1 [Seminavis robusta]|uniref:Uncharacterized protein n=1 Tax=Seminavis robusta TaxID=568900 RepID=A0A9N8DWM7_9STRA|nr:hypothetical protein SEMRO_336_G120320.1 [Seminavis robusta]|eukprot:Sro336_g120320.1 n/a (465) ;mRNA; f:30365-31759